MNNMSPTSAEPRTNEELVAQELALRRARKEAAERDTAGISTTFKVLTVVFACGSIIPVVGIASVFCCLVLGAFGSVLLLLKGNPGGAVRQALLTILGSGAGGIAWAVVTFVVLAASA